MTEVYTPTVTRIAFDCGLLPKQFTRHVLEPEHAPAREMRETLYLLVVEYYRNR